MSIVAIQNQEKRKFCPHCSNDDSTMMTLLGYLMSEKGRMYLCEVCGRAFKALDENP